MSYDDVLLNRLKAVFFGDKNPIFDPVWWLLVCPVCGKTMLAPPNVFCVHVAEDHVAEYVVDSENVTWKEAREIVNVDDVLGLGLPGMKHDDADWKMHIELVKILDVLAGVHMKGRDNYLNGKGKAKSNEC